MDDHHKPAIQTHTKRRCVYLPPPAEMIENYAHKVCHRLRKEDGTNYDIGFVQDFTRFVKTVVQIQAKYLNPGGENVC